MTRRNTTSTNNTARTANTILTRPASKGTIMHRPRLLPAAIIAAATAIALSACSTAAKPDSTPSVDAASAVTVHDGWVKAADSGMSAAFGELINSSDQDVTLVSAESPASPELELHETVENEAGESMMRQKEGGFLIPAGGSLTLMPGGSHIMLMGLSEPIVAGDEIAFTLRFSDDSTTELSIPAKDYAGANENYEDGESGTSEHDGHQHGSSGDSEDTHEGHAE